MKLATIVTLVNLILDKFKRNIISHKIIIVFFNSKKAVAILGEFRYNQINF